MIKDAIKEELLKRIEEEESKCFFRKYGSTQLEIFQIRCEEHFLEKLKDFANSI